MNRFNSLETQYNMLKVCIYFRHFSAEYSFHSGKEKAILIIWGARVA